MKSKRIKCKKYQVNEITLILKLCFALLDKRNNKLIK